jgi:hypothetical protein
MKHLLTGVAVIAALAFSGAISAQPTSPGGNSVGMPGPNPGGPGLTPYTTRPRQAPPPSSMSPAPMYPSAAPAPATTSGDETTAPPRYPRARAQSAAQKRAPKGQHGAGSETTAGDIADQLNQQELSRVQAGNFTSQPGAPPPRPRPQGTRRPAE